MKTFKEYVEEKTQEEHSILIGETPKPQSKESSKRPQNENENEKIFTNSNFL